MTVSNTDPAAVARKLREDMAQRAEEARRVHPSGSDRHQLGCDVRDLLLENSDQRATIDSLSAEVARLRGREREVIDALPRYVTEDSVVRAKAAAAELEKLITDICRIRGECEADDELRKFVHYIDHALQISPGEASRIIDFAQGQMKRAESAERSLAAALSEVERLTGALDLVMIGGNHLANVLIQKRGPEFADKWPPDMEPDDALRTLCATTEFDVWCCWRAIMQARAALSTDHKPDKMAGHVAVELTGKASG